MLFITNKYGLYSWNLTVARLGPLSQVKHIFPDFLLSFKESIYWHSPIILICWSIYITRFCLLYYCVIFSYMSYPDL